MPKYKNTGPKAVTVEYADKLFKLEPNKTAMAKKIKHPWLKEVKGKKNE